MLQTSKAVPASVDSIKIGTTGTIGSLISQELESAKSNSIQTSSSSRSKSTIISVSVPCIHAPKRTQSVRNPTTESSSRKNSNGGHRSPNNSNKTNKQKALKKGQFASILSNNDAITDKKDRSSQDLGKKERTHIVEVVDVKCNNPRSCRLKKLGFLKLNESIG